MIDIWYMFVQWVLPFEWASHTFMRNALLAVIVASPIYGVLGTMIVNSRMAFFSDALGHSALTGIAIGVILGITNPAVSMLLFAAVFGIAILVVKNTNRTSTDTVIGVFSSATVAMGVLILSRNGGFSKYSAFLIGDLLSITPKEIFFLILIAVVILVFWLFFFNRLLLFSVNPALARSRGYSVKTLEIVFVLIIAIVVTSSIQWVGLLIINALLVLPAASARNFSENIKEYHLFSVLIALFSGISGLILSYVLNTATGATIVIMNFCFFGLSFLFRILRYRHI